MGDERFEGMSQETLVWLMRRALGGGLVFLVVGGVVAWAGAESLSAGEDIGVLGVLSGLVFIGLSVMFFVGAARIRRRQQRQP